MVVHGGDDCVVMAIPRHHGDFGFEVAFLFARWLNSEPGEERDAVRTILHASTSEQSDFPLIILLLALAKQATSWQLYWNAPPRSAWVEQNINLEKKLDFLSFTGKSNFSVTLQQ